jgi:hypothetical protein
MKDTPHVHLRREQRQTREHCWAGAIRGHALVSPGTAPSPGHEGGANHALACRGVGDRKIMRRGARGGCTLIIVAGGASGTRANRHRTRVQTISGSH